VGHFKPVAFLILSLIMLSLVKPTFGYSIITHVELYAPVEAEVNEEIAVQADIHTGNNLVESVHNVSATLLLPASAKVISGPNPLFIGEMGPGPANASCHWTVELEEVGMYFLMVNASCINTQNVPQWTNASTTIEIYAPPYAEFESVPATKAYVDDNVTFNATNSYARGPSSTIVTYAWDFGDGTNTTTEEPTTEHTFLGIGNYTVTLNVTDNKELSGVNTTTISISLFGDLNSDGNVNIVDITIVATAYGSNAGQSNWNPIADLNNDGVVNILDIAQVAVQYGKSV
jgi:PKD repeat protein